MITLRCFVFQNHAQFLTTRQYVNFQNTIFSFEILIFGRKFIQFCCCCFSTGTLQGDECSWANPGIIQLYNCTMAFLNSRGDFVTPFVLEKLFDHSCSVELASLVEKFITQITIIFNHLQLGTIS